jgi:hypothetical protein
MKRIVAFLGFKSFAGTAVMIAGIELAHRNSEGSILAWAH